MKKKKMSKIFYLLYRLNFADKSISVYGFKHGKEFMAIRKQKRLKKVV
jgi:hypothetical protein